MLREMNNIFHNVAQSVNTHPLAGFLFSYQEWWIQKEKQKETSECVKPLPSCFWTYHLISREPVPLLLDAGFGALAAHSQGLHHQSILHSQAQLPGCLFRVHPIDAA